MYPHNWHNFQQSCDIAFLFKTEDPKNGYGSAGDAIFQTTLRLHGGLRNMAEAALHDYLLPEGGEKATIFPEEGYVEEDNTLWLEFKNHFAAIQAHKAKVTPTFDQKINKRLLTFDTRLKPSHFQNTEELASYLGILLAREEYNFNYKSTCKIRPNYDRITGEFDFSAFTESDLYMHLFLVTSNRYIFDILGMLPFAVARDSTKPFFVYHTGRRPIRAKGLDDFNLMYVYSDIASDQPVGDTEVPLLGVLPVQGLFPEQSYWACNPAFYVPVAKKYVDTVEIQLNTDDGRLVPFTEGKVLVRLHFRRSGLLG
jgi:hypothetical protein